MAYPVLKTAECERTRRRSNIYHQNQKHGITRIEAHYLLSIDCCQRDYCLNPRLIKHETCKKSPQIAVIAHMVERVCQPREGFAHDTSSGKMLLG